MVKLCSIERINDLMGNPNFEGYEGNPIIVSGGTCSLERGGRLIDVFSSIINHKHKTNYQYTTYTQEIYDVTGLPFIILDNFPISSVILMQYWDGDEWVDMDEGWNRTNDDYYMSPQDKVKGMVRFWDVPTMGEAQLRVTYIAGHYDDTIDDTYPNEDVQQCCAYMVAIEIAMSKQFQEEQKDNLFKWKQQITLWNKSMNILLSDGIERRHSNRPLAFGRYYNESSESALWRLT